MKKIRFREKRPLILLNPEKILGNPYNPRQTFEEKNLSSLAQSIRENGMMQPLTVRKTKEGYMLIAGKRRLMAAKKIGMKKVPCMVAKVSVTQGAVMSLLENMQREPMSFLEEAKGLEQLLTKLELSPEDAAASLGISCSVLKSTLDLLTLTPWQQERIASANLSRSHAAVFLTLPSEEDRNTCILQTIAGGFTPAQTRELAEKIQKEKGTPPPKRKTVISDLRLLENTLSHAVTTLNRCGMSTKMEKTESPTKVEFTLQVEKIAEEHTNPPEPTIPREF